MSTGSNRYQIRPLPIVSLANTGVQPFAMVVKDLNAFVADAAVLAPLLHIVSAHWKQKEWISDDVFHATMQRVLLTVAVNSAFGAGQCWVALILIRRKQARHSMKADGCAEYPHEGPDPADL